MFAFFKGDEMISGAYDNKPADQKLIDFQNSHGRDVELRQTGTDGKYATYDVNGTLGIKGSSVRPGDPGTQLPSQGMVPGPGGAIVTESVPGVQPPGPVEEAPAAKGKK